MSNNAAMDSGIDKIRYLLTSCFVLLILSCNSNNRTITRDAQRVIDCNMDDAVRLVNLSDICDSIAVIPLDDKHLVGTVNLIRSDESGIYLTTRNNILHSYGWDGKECFYIDRQGRALSDYLEIGDFALSERYIAIADPEGMKILLFDKGNGQYYKTIQVDFYPEDLAFINEETLAVNCGGVDGPRLVILDIEKEEVIDGYLSYDKIFSEPLMQPFAAINGSVLYRIPFYNDFYSVSSGGKLEKTLSFDFKAKNFNVKDLKYINVMGFNFLIDSKGNACIDNMYTVNSMFAVNFKCQSISEDSQFLMLVDTLNGTKYLFDSETTNDDVLFYDIAPLPLFYDSNEKGFISVLYPDLWTSTFGSIDGKHKNTANYRKALSLFQTISKTENPAILVYRFKSPSLQNLQ